MNIYSWHPVPYSPFHLGWFLVTILIAILLCYFFGRKHDDKTDKIIVFVIGCILLGGEIFKQIYYSVKSGEYRWDQFPLQFCSLSMYFSFASFFFKKESTREHIYTFLATYGFVAGLAVMIEPSGVFWYKYTLLVVHSIIWHSSMIILAIYLMYARNTFQKIKEMVMPLIYFLASVIVAVVFNEVMYYALFKNYIEDDVCEAFYISSHYRSNLPILSDLQPIVPYFVLVIGYFVAFSLAALLVWLVVFGIKKLANKEKEKRA